jgi:hypothetical protein
LLRSLDEAERDGIRGSGISAGVERSMHPPRFLDAALLEMAPTAEISMEVGSS